MSTLISSPDQTDPTGPRAENVNGEFSTPSGTFTYPLRSTGAFAGNVEISNAASSSGDQFHFEYIKTITLGPYSHDYGVKLDWDFTVDGSALYSYNLPFEASFGFPWFVYPSQSINLIPTFSWHTKGLDPSITVTHDYSFAHKTSVWCDAPGDGLDDLAINFTQEPSKARLDLEIPSVPGAPSFKVGTDVTIPPFDTGGGEYGGSCTKLGGTGTLTNIGATVYYEDPTSITINASPYSASAVAWKQGHELFELVATILKMIPVPVTIAAGEALEVAKTLAGLKLETQIDGSIVREDFVALIVSDCSPIHVNGKLKPGDTWKFDLNVEVNYRIIVASDFYYPISYNATFDMRAIDPKPLGHGDMLWIPAGRATAESTHRKGIFHITGKLPVIQKGGNPPPVIRQLPPSCETAQQLQSKGLVAMLTRGRLSNGTDTKTVLLESERIACPKPVDGQLKGRQFTVILGLASPAVAATIIQAFTKKGFSAFATPVQNSRQVCVTLGTFTNRSEAETLSDILRAERKIKSYVSAGIEEEVLKPIEKDVLQKVHAS